MVPVVSGFLLSFVPIKTGIHYSDDHQTEFYTIKHLYDCAWAGGAFGLLSLVFLWLLWGAQKKTDDQVA
jgi:hypothetical protein